MSLSPEAIDALVAAGASAEMLAAAFKAELAAEEARKAAKRENARERQARKRAKDRIGNAVSLDVTCVTRDERDTPDKEVSPTPPSRNYPPKGGDITTREREEPNDFDRFWAAYPRKIGKDDARRKFAAAIKAGAAVDDLIEAVERDRHGQWAGRPPDMVPHPATWLHQGRWKDEPPPQQPNSPRPDHERRSPQSAKLDERFENYQRAVAGAQIAAERGALKPPGGF